MFFAGNAGGEGPCDILCVLFKVLSPSAIGNCVVVAINLDNDGM